MSYTSVEKLQETLLAKKKKYSVRVTVKLGESKATSFLKGSLKDLFLQDCIDRGIHEAAMLRVIIDSYYALAANVPEIYKQGSSEIKKYIEDKIKF